MITLHFINDVNNDSLQVGDMAYYVKTQDSPMLGTGTVFKVNANNIQEIGEVFHVYETSIVCKFECDHPTPTGADCNAHIPDINSFIMFSKDNAANMSSILGYYAEVEMVNDSNYKAKLFAVSTDISESSK